MRFYPCGGAVAGGLPSAVGPTTGRAMAKDRPYWISGKEAADVLGIPEATFEDLVEAGVIPPGEKINPRVVRWRSDVIGAVAVLLPHLRNLKREEGS